MNKENLSAIILGLTLGTTAALCIWAVKSGNLTLPFKQFSFPNLSPSQKNISIKLPTPTAQKQKEAFEINLTSPENGIITNDKEIEISGKTNRKATIILSQDNNDLIIPLKSDGSFSTKSTLVSGPNSLIVTAIDENDNVSQESRIVIYEEQK